MELINLTSSQGVLLSSWRDLKALLNKIPENSTILDNPISIQDTNSGDLVDAYAAAVIEPEVDSDKPDVSPSFSLEKELCLLLDY